MIRPALTELRGWVHSIGRPVTSYMPRAFDLIVPPHGAAMNVTRRLLADNAPPAESWAWFKDQQAARASGGSVQPDLAGTGHAGPTGSGGSFIWGTSARTSTRRIQSAGIDASADERALGQLTLRLQTGQAILRAEFTSPNPPGNLGSGSPRQRCRRATEACVPPLNRWLDRVVTCSALSAVEHTFQTRSSHLFLRRLANLGRFVRVTVRVMRCSP